MRSLRRAAFVRSAVFGFVALAAVICAPACSGSKDCSSYTDCGSDETCSFDANQGCGAKGKCVSWGGECQGARTAVCDCTGKTVYVACGFPGMPVPVKSQGICGMGGECTAFGDCDPQLVCAFPIADGCNAKGHCIAPDDACLDTKQDVACSCDGSIIGLSCTFGAGNAVAPVRSLGACAHDGGTTTDAASDAPLD